MAETQGVWGIDIGQAGLKAIRLKYAEAADQVLAVAFDYVPHPKILSQPDAIPDELISQALEQFLSRNDVKGDKVCISVPGQTALTRFIQLPPVESGKVAEIVKYEARQQIPFALEDVCWQWQTLGGGTEESGYMLEAEVGLFAMKRDQVMQHLRPFLDKQVEVDLVQIAPLGLYNYLAYDRLGMRPGKEAAAKDDHTIVLDMGADNTTLMVSNGQKIWIRNVPIGGNHFTRALTKEMKLTFAKAEHLKINATKAPDPRAVFQALRPVFNDYVAEIQRSIGYFSSVNRNAKIGKIIGLGNGFKLAGLQKFLQQNLQYEVERADAFHALVGDSVLNSNLFDENRLSFAVPYGLALQGLGLTRIHVDLLPTEIRTERMIRQKKPWAVLTAASLLLATAFSATFYARKARSATGKPWDDAIAVAKDVADKAAADKQLYDGKVAEFNAQAEKNAQIIRSKEGRVNWLAVKKAWLECLPRDKADTFAENEITKKNRIKVWKWTATKYKDLKTEWYDRLAEQVQGFEGYLRPEDRTNPPQGEGYVVTLELVHYHEERDPKTGQLTAQGNGANWVRKMFMSKLRKWRVSNQFPQPTGDVPVREIGITHPLIVDEGRTEYFTYILDRRKVNRNRLEGTRRGDIDRRGFRNFDGESRPDVDSGGRNKLGVRLGAPKKKLKKEEKDENTIEIPITRCTVQFVWKPVPFEKRMVFNQLYEYFRNHPNGVSDDEGNLDRSKTFAAAQTFIAQENERRTKENARKKKLGDLDLIPLLTPLTQELFDEFAKKHYVKAAPPVESTAS